MVTTKQYNIMTSCDDVLAPYIAVNLTAIAHNLSDSHIDFFLLHSRVSQENLDMLDALSQKYKNITFHEVRVPNPEVYEALAELGGGWTGEAYYSACAHLLLPQDIDRVLYLDAADTLIVGDIEPYYSYDFQDKALVVTAFQYRWKNNKLELFETEDLGDWEGQLLCILRGFFNSGSYMMNLKKMRKDGLTLTDYIVLAQELYKIFDGKEDLAAKLYEHLDRRENALYFGDEGLLSAAFVGNVRYYGFPQIQDVWYMPYNFCIWYYNRKKEKPAYVPSILHFTGTAFKPWEGNYPIFLKRFQKKEKLHLMEELKLGQAGYFYQWHEYAVIADQVLSEIDR